MTTTPWHALDIGWRREQERPRRDQGRRVAGRFLAALRDWRRRVRERNELAALDERTLRDIGLTRADLDYLESKERDRDDAWYESLRFPPF
jgi:uncharacterized protein YjiS (DUF1127 family)